MLWLPSRASSRTRVKSSEGWGTRLERDTRGHTTMALALFFVYRAMQPAPATALAKICASARDLNVFLGYAMTSLSFIASNLALALAFDVAWPIGLASRAALVVFADFWICVMSHAVRSVPRKPLAATRFMAFEGLPAACLLHWVISSALRHSFWWCAMVWALTAAHVACTWQKTTTRAVAVTPAPAHSPPSWLTLARKPAAFKCKDDPSLKQLEASSASCRRSTRSRACLAMHLRLRQKSAECVLKRFRPRRAMRSSRAQRTIRAPCARRVGPRSA